ncbi:MAG: hypothetical protein DRQ60_02300 [Gammaproteobacteria bacterium]|nr:MAG: hypothetical protein DRQ60_02300 [Gammaproteobacteria bacterium]
MLYSIQGYRGIAALLVVLFHGTLKIEYEYGITPLFGIFKNGFSGVHLFFVLSGFIILTAHVKDIGNPSKLGWYFKRRLIRIYPIYWIVFFVLGGWKLVFRSMDLEAFFLNAFLFLPEAEQVIQVSWTLLYEIIFYIFFASLILNKKLGLVTIAAWFISILLIWNSSSPVFLHHFNLLFIFGISAAVLRFKLIRFDSGISSSIAKTCVSLGVVLFLGTSIYYSSLNVSLTQWPTHPVTIFGFGLASFLLVLGSASPGVEAFFRRHKIMSLLGNASYSIYLVHYWCLKAVFNLVRSLMERSTGIVLNDEAGQSLVVAGVLFVVIVVPSVWAGIWVHLKVEQPLLLFLRKKVLK